MRDDRTDDAQHRRDRGCDGEAHDVEDRTFGSKRYRHPTVGELRIGYEAMRLPDDADQLLLIYTTERGSRSEQAMRLLDSWGAEALEVTGYEHPPTDGGGSAG